MKIKSCLKGIGFWVVTLTLALSPMPVSADCQVVGTIGGGYIIDCIGIDNIYGVSSGNGDDIITVESGAEASKIDQQSLDSIATTNAIAIDAGGGDNRVINYGSITGTADANALPVDGSASQATANAAGISAGDGEDVIKNSSKIAATATSNSESGDVSLTLEGNTQSQSMTTSTATSTGIMGGDGNNQVTNSGGITTTVISEAEAPFIDLKLTDTAKADASITAQATGTGISGEGSIVNQQTGTITVNVTSQATTDIINARLEDSAQADVSTTAQTTATGVTGSVGNDTITSAGTITLTSTSEAEATVDLETGTDEEINAIIKAESIAVGIDSGEGDDTIINHSTLSTTSTASAGSDNVNTSIWAPGVTDTTTKSIAVSTGILSGLGKDAITNEGSMTVYSEATTEVSNVLLSGGIEVALSTDVKGGTTSEATALGIDGGADDDQITNKATIHASSSATTSSHDVLLSLVGIGTFATPTTATAGSVGIDGGDGKDELTNSGTVTVNATSSADALNISVSGFQLDVVSDGDASTKAVAHVTGISGGGGDDKVTNTGTVTATADSTASIIDISVEFLGSSHSEASTIAEALATGIHGEAGTDEIKNNGTITVSAESEVDALGVDVKFKSIPTKVLEWFGVNLVDATTAARAIATGIDGGENGDTITNESSIDVTADAEADSDKISVKLPLPTTSGSQSGAALASGGPVLTSGTIGTGRATEPGLTGSEVQSATLENAEVVGDDEFFDTGTTAQATATGIAGGGGGDTITNKSGLKATGISNAESLSVQASVNLGKGGLSIFKIVPNVAVVDATTTAEAEVTGIDGGAGNDTITNEADVEANADQVESTSTLVDVALSGATEKGLAWGGALSDATTKAVSTVRGIAGSEGDDTITNSGKIKAVTSPDADSVSVSAALMGAKEGLVAGFTYVDASTTAEGAATGIAGGADNDTITNTSTGEIEVTSEPTSTSAQVGVTLEGAFSKEWSAVLGGAMTDGTTKAISNAAGISGGDGDDTVTNSGKITVKANPDADSASVSATLTGAGDGLTVGFTYADNTTTAEANAVGIDGGSGSDTITNTSTGQIEVTADPTSSSASVSATITGVTKGTGIVGGAALTDGTTKAISNVAGIKGGEGDDTITNSGKIIVKSNPDADSASVSVNLGAAMGELGLVGGFSYADATTTAQATAIGIDGGPGDDTITNTGEIEVTTESTASSASIGVTAQGVKGMGAAVGISLTDGTTKAISTATGIAGGEGNDTITNSGKITVKALPDADSASVSVTLSAAKEGVAAGGTFADATTTAQATATGIDGGEGNDTITNSGTIEVTADSESSSASVSVSAEGTTTGATLGVALSNGTTKAISNATGIKGGGDNDTITNFLISTVTSTADIASASVSVNLGGAETGLVAGVAAANVKTTAESAATGISGDSGDDTIENLDLMTATAKSTISSAGVSVNAGIAVNGAAVGAAIADGKTEATSSAVGLEGGAGNDTVINRGFNVVSATSEVTAANVAVNLEGTQAGLAGGVSLVDGENRANALAIGISGGSGDDTIGNYTGGFLPYTWVEATTTSTRTNVSVTGNFSLYGAALGASFADATNVAVADARGIEGEEGKDEITNTSNLVMDATTTAETTSVAVSANVAIFGAGLGASLASAETTGSALATGISGGKGDDQIENTGFIMGTSNATAKAKAISVDISYASFSTADVTTTAIADSAGMTGGSGQDRIFNEGIINLDATSTGDGVAGTGQLTGYGAASVDVNSWAMTTGIEGGTEDDTIANRNKITTLSNATAKGRSVSVNLAGAVFAEAGTKAHALTAGLSGGAGADKVTNEGSIDLTATSNADLTGVSVTLLGYSNSDGSSLSEAIAMGMDGGYGENTLTNTSTGSIKATTTGYADTASVSVNLAGAVKADAGSTATASSIGMAGGKEQDTIGNEGNITLNATSDTDASAYAVQLIGYGDSSAKAISAATVKGIESGDGVNTITNSPSGTITGTATALADASSYDIQLSGGAKATAGTEATATAIGIAGGKDTDTIQNEGTINLAAGSSLVSSSRSYKIFGEGEADADSNAVAIAIGIDGGDGVNTITNASTGSITASSNASAKATSMTANIGVAGASASTTSKAHSTGIKSGDDQDAILNEGNITVATTSSTGAAGGNFSVIGLSFGDSLTEAIAEGINAGGEKDTIINTGSITVGSVQDNDHPMAYAEVASISFSFFNISSAIFGSKAQATGIIGGGGDDTILNTGTIIVGDDDWMAKGRGYGFSGNFLEFLSLTSVGTTAETIATGVEGGDGNDTLLNDTSGVLTVKATSYADAEGAGDTTFGNLAAFASSTTKATATGMSGGGGDDGIENKGMISVGAKTWANAYSDAEAGWGGPTSDAAANATATASGIDAGKGQNLVRNEGQIAVNSAASATPIARSDADIGRTEAETTAYAKALAFGILAGDDGNTVVNATTGTINVTATARTDDGLGNIAKAFQDVDAKATAHMWDNTAKKWLPVTANAAGISLGDGADLVKNDGVITVTASSFPSVNAYTSSNVYTARSDAETYASAIAKGIAAGMGANEVINNGQINVNAWGHGNPITDSWSRDQTATANAVAESSATATGIEGDGNIANTSLGNIDVKARATTNAYANTSAETTTPTATLVATATGIGTASSADSTVRDRLWNDGNITVTAVAGEDENGNNKEIAYADTDTWVRSCRATATGTSTVDATGIRVGERGAEITNNGNLEVSGLAHAYLRAYADSRDYHPRGNAYSTAIAKATGISASGGDNLINNYSTMKVEARVQDAYTRGDTWSSWSTCRSLAETNATATATGIRTEAGKDEINNYGQLTVVADADAESYAWADTRDNNLADEYETTTATAQADAIGIDAGAGNNSVNHSGSMSVSAVANARAGAGGGHASVTRTEQAAASAVGIQTGSGDDSIVIRTDSNLVAIAEGTALDANVRATGIDAGDGKNILQSQSSISVAANATGIISADAEVVGIKKGSSSDRIALRTGSLINTAAHATSSSENGVTNASAIGIDAGEGTNQITNYGVVNSNADATAEVKREEIFWWSITYPATANSSVTGIKSGNEVDIINNYGEIMVNSKASAVINQVLDLSAGTKSATANAIGIDAGDGDNFVANYGTLDVGALAAAGTGANPNARTDGVENTTAIGIMTGDGDDTIINSGTINTANQRLEWVGGWIHITSQSGIAITTGGGSDQLFLMDGSETNGHIDLGDGDDWLTFMGTPLVAGDVIGAAGTDSLVFEGAGSIGFTFSPVTFENAIKQGAGTFIVTNLPTMPRIEVNQGTLQINNDYAMASDSTFQTNVNGDGSHGQLKVNGTAQLAGDLKVIKGPGPYTNGTTYDIIEADTLNGLFSNLMLPTPTALLSFEMNQLPDSVEIETSAKNFTTVAKNRVHWIIANYLDGILPAASGDLSYVLGEFQNLSWPQYGTAFSSLSPDSYENFTRGTLFATQQYNKSLQYRMNNVRYHSMAGSRDNEKPILLAYSGSDASLGQLFTPGELSPIQGKSGLWLDAFGQWGDQDEEDGFTGYDYFLRGATLGFDHRLMDKLMAGVSLGYSRSDIDLDQNKGSGDVKSLFGSLYGSYFDKNLYIDAILSYGRNWYDNSRRIIIGGILRRATSDHDAHLFSGYLGGGYYFDFNPWAFGPYGSLQYIRLDEESFEERGAGAISLRVDDRQTDALVSELGLRLVRLIRGKCGNFIPEVSLGWSHDFDIDDHVVRASFAGSPGASFSIEGQDVERNGLVLGAGLTFIHKGGFSTSFRYKGDFRRDYKSNAIMGEIRYSF